MIVDKVKTPSDFPAPAEPLSAAPEIRPTPLAALGLPRMPTALHFVRSHFGVPPIEPEPWFLEVGGAVERPLRISLAELRRRPALTQTVVLECAGHRRAEFRPGTSGLQWAAGAVSEASWTGIPLAELLAEALPVDGACELVVEGTDRGPRRAAGSEVPFARSIPLEWASSRGVLLSWEMNGEPIPPTYGGPLRVIVPGCYAVDSVKWLRRIDVREHPFHGPFQTHDYRLLGVAGDANGSPLHELRVSALILEPEPSSVVRGGLVEVTGVAWGGSGGIADVEVRLAGGPGSPAALMPSLQPHGLSHWSALLEAPPGDHTVEARARDQAGNVQPETPEWNVHGYANNSVHRVPILVRR